MDTPLDAMLRTIDAHFADTRGETGCAAMGPRVRAALAAVPRHRFVPLTRTRAPDGAL